jgi:hypothetical protein
VVPELSDTDPEVARFQLALLRRATPEQRLHLALSLSDSVIGLSRAGIASRLGASADETRVGLEFVALHYGADLAATVRRALEARRR